MRNLFRKLASLFGESPKSLFALIRQPRPASTSKLYVIEVDFNFGEDQRRALDEALNPIRAKYSLDFFVVEPGLKLKRFDDF
jgi:hypothetical protein